MDDVSPSFFYGASGTDDLCLQDYGEVPRYLQQRREEQQRAQEDFEDFVKDHREQGVLTNLSEDRRQAVLEVRPGRVRLNV